jgi:hypothetical protein
MEHITITQLEIIECCNNLLITTKEQQKFLKSRNRKVHRRHMTLVSVLMNMVHEYECDIMSCFHEQQNCW